MLSICTNELWCCLLYVILFYFNSKTSKNPTKKIISFFVLINFYPYIIISNRYSTNIILLEKEKRKEKK